MMFSSAKVIASGDGAVAIAGNVNTVVTNSGPQSGGVPLAIARQHLGPVFDAVSVEHFTGREWLLADVDRFLRSRSSGYVFVEAEAGLGKTAFAAHLAFDRGYVAHFSRQPRGQSTTTALRSLSAQLINKYELSDLTPGGLLPEWATTADGFGSILVLAAEKARRFGDRVVLIADGLDEADPEGTELPWGLPSLLPSGVFVVATYRTGTTPWHPHAPSITLRIHRAGAENLDDVQRYLKQAVKDEDITGTLTLSPADADRLAQRLAELTRGTWIYLRYLLEEIRLGHRELTAIDHLPTDLLDFYAKQIWDWRASEEWNALTLPVLQALCVAREPLTAEALAALSGGKPLTRVRQLCDGPFRPFLTVSGAEDRRYSIYHLSLREFLEGRARLPENRSDALETLTIELRQAAVTAHTTIIELMLDRYGGIESGLPALAGDPSLSAQENGYGLRNLVHHLTATGRHDDVWALLNCEVAHGGDSYNVWYRAHEVVADFDGYVNDLELAQHAVSAPNDDAIRTGSAPRIGWEVSCQIYAAAVRTKAAYVEPGLIPALIEEKVWDLHRAFAHTRQLAGEELVKANIALLPFVADSERESFLEDTLSEVSAVASARYRCWLLTSLLPLLPDELRTRALAEAIAAARADTDMIGIRLLEVARVADAETAAAIVREVTAGTYGIDIMALSKLIELDPSRAERYKAAVFEATKGTNSQFSIGLRARSAPPGELDEVLAQIRSCERSARIEGLLSISNRFTSDRRASILQEAVSCAMAEEDPFMRFEGLMACLNADDLPARSSVVEEAHAIAWSIQPPILRREALTHMLPELVGTARRAAAVGALEATRLDIDGESYLLALVAMLRFADDATASLIAQSIVQECATGDGLRPWYYISALTGLAEAGFGELAVSAARANPAQLSLLPLILAELARHLPQPAAEQVSCEARDLLAHATPSSNYFLAYCAMALADQAEDDDRHSFLEEAIAITGRCPTGGGLLTDLAEVCTTDLLPQLLKVAFEPSPGDARRSTSDWRADEIAVVVLRATTDLEEPEETLTLLFARLKSDDRRMDVLREVVLRSHPDPVPRRTAIAIAERTVAGYAGELTDLSPESAPEGVSPQSWQDCARCPMGHSSIWQLLDQLRMSMTSIHETGGERAVADVYQAIENAKRWWP
ncbi:hypothetical protein AB0C12_17270 [Actinoplanes sp. NPDC048967]|uniref:hypothetical protein n=1 Tax=Actinoplanes sp. NPDC048967 TaxID=3155269 RepID=UPI0033C4B89B